MYEIHDILWDYLKCIRNQEALAAWLKEANAVLARNGLEKQTDALAAQRLLKTITRHHLFFL